MKTIGILYIATGIYTVFWEEFYKSFEEHFLKHTEKHYFVFTDAKHLYGEENPRIHKTYLHEEPWPLPTLLKFHRFLEIEDELRKMDYLYQSNGPIVCLKEVKEEDFLPRAELGETMMFTQHPGHYLKKTYNRPYERRRESYAYVPYHKGTDFVFGAMNGGTAEAYLHMCKVLDKRIVLDLNKGVIARAHDESHINCYLVELENYRLLPMAYAYPTGFDVPGDKIIACVDKAKYFDVDAVKGNTKDTDKRAKRQQSIKAAIDKRIRYVKGPLLYARDAMTGRKIHEF
ncbi:MAG: glycosyl transferase family 6 [Agathobacter sp.]